MKSNDFNDMYELRIDKSRKVLVVKGKEYSGKDDRLHNFKRVAEFARVTPEQACLVLMGKHLIGIVDAVVDEAEITQEWIDEKVGDSFNYHPLLEGLFTERMERQNEHS